MTNPMEPEKFRKVNHGRVVLGEHVVVCAGSILLPGVKLARGASVGALSLVRKDVPEFTVVAGNPQRTLGPRNRELLLRLEQEFRDGRRGQGADSV